MRSRAVARVGAAVGGAVLLFGVAALGVAGHLDGAGTRPASSARPTVPIAQAPTGTDALAASITSLQTHLRDVPTDANGWATLGLDYVQQAKVTVDPSYYPKADGVLARSLKLQPTGNFFADAGEAALAAARHDFVGARSWAQRGLQVDSYNSTLYGALDDADTQLGRYDEAFKAVQKMLDLKPGTPAFSRAEYVFELRGQLPQARAAMQSALNDAATPADTAFAHYYLGQLDFDAGDPAGALGEYARGLRADPTYVALIEGRAKAEAALGRTDAAISDYADVVGRVPQPQYVVEYGELLQSLGRTAQAQQEYALFQAEDRLFEANGVALDTDPTLFYADHGDPVRALHYGQQGIKIRPFLEMDDAYAWALHVNHRDAEALQWERKAHALGTRSALFDYHLGMIDLALHDKTGARKALTSALRTNRYFNPLQGPTAEATLTHLGGPV